jgi:hypothetical protein
MTTRYKMVQLYVDPKDYKQLQRELKKRGLSASAFLRAEIFNYLTKYSSKGRPNPIEKV